MSYKYVQIHVCYYEIYTLKSFGSKLFTIVTMITIIYLFLDLQLPMQSVLTTTDIVSSNLDQGEVYNITLTKKEYNVLFFCLSAPD